MKVVTVPANVEMLQSNGIVPSTLPNGFVPLDIDVTPFDNSKTKKEEVSRTYKGFDGYAPIMAYLGTEGYLINAKLREGKQHCQCDTPAFLRETISLCRQITDAPLLVRLDSGNDSAENIGILLEMGCYFIIKRNLRRESREDWLAMAKENSRNISTPREGKTVYIGSDWKTVSWNSKEGETQNATIRTGYEILERTIGRRTPKNKHKVRRRRLRTVIGDLIRMACHVTSHARQLILNLGRSNPWRWCFAEVYTAFADFRL